MAHRTSDVTVTDRDGKQQVTATAWSDSTVWIEVGAVRVELTRSAWYRLAGLDVE